jgi:hypothetical protein
MLVIYLEIQVMQQFCLHKTLIIGGEFKYNMFDTL